MRLPNCVMCAVCHGAAPRYLPEDIVLGRLGMGRPSALLGCGCEAAGAFEALADLGFGVVTALRGSCCTEAAGKLGGSGNGAAGTLLKAGIDELTGNPQVSCDKDAGAGADCIVPMCRPLTGVAVLGCCICADPA